MSEGACQDQRWKAKKFAIIQQLHQVTLLNELVTGAFFYKEYPL